MNWNLFLEGYIAGIIFPCIAAAIIVIARKYKNKTLFCKHEYKHYRNIYGDEINTVSTRKTYRSLWHCNKCGKIQRREYLV